jgi:DNA replication protein DnaC
MDRFEKHIKEMQEEWEALPEEEKERILDEERLKDALNQREELITNYKQKGIPPRFYDAMWNTWIADTEDKKKAFNTVKEKAWRTNLFLCGKSGTGKTHLAMCLAKDGASYRRLTDIFREVRMNFSVEQDVINHYGTTKLLIIDEVGRQKFTPFEQNLFFDIIDKRYNNMLNTTIITNLSTDEFSREFGAAILDRLRPVRVNFNWESYREIEAEEIDF